MRKEDLIFETYAEYLAESVADMKFIDKDSLKEYLKTHLNLFYNECLDDHLLTDLDRRRNFLIHDNRKLLLERSSIENQILVAKYEKNVDTKWLRKAKYAFNIKGIQMQNNMAEMGKISAIIKLTNIEKSNTENRELIKCIIAEFAERSGKEASEEFILAARKRLINLNQNENSKL